MSENILEVRNLSFSYDTNLPETFSGINFEVKSGEIFVILGANGAGKSTLLNCVTGNLNGYNGEIILQGKDLKDIPINERARIMGYVPQLSMPAFNYTVRDYVVMGRAPYIGLMGTPGPDEYAIADEVIRQMNIEKLAGKYITRISGGERQQVQIAKVLAQQTRLIILDEPTNHLDFGNQLKILRIIKNLTSEGPAVILTTHMPDHAFLLNGNTGILTRNGTMKAGRVHDVLTEDMLMDLYNTDLRLVHIAEYDRDVCVAGKEAGI